MKKSKKSSKTRVTEVSIKFEWFIIAALSVLVIGSIVTAGFTILPLNLKSPTVEFFSGPSLSDDEIREKVGDYISSQLLQGTAEAEISDVQKDEDVDSLYRVNVSIQGQSFDSFVTKDGKYLFPERIDMENVEVEIPQE